MPAKRLALVLAAGFGTRMGEIGKQLPKVLWPVFEKSILELQVLFARSLGYDTIYVNLHHQRAEILRRTQGLESFAGVRWLIEEPEILDIGGAVHNLAAQPEVGYSGELLILNADQFIWFTAAQLESWRRRHPDADALLLGWNVNSSDGYNMLVVDADRRFRGITPNAEVPRDTIGVTYTGNSLVRLDRLAPRPGASKFFDTVCTASGEVYVENVPADAYWDFGTAKRYVDSLFRILELSHLKAESPFLEFLTEQSALRPQKVRSRTSYDAVGENCINLSGAPLPRAGDGLVVLEGDPGGRASSAGVTICYRGVQQPVS